MTDFLWWFSATHTGQIFVNFIIFSGSIYGGLVWFGGGCGFRSWWWFSAVVVAGSDGGGGLVWWWLRVQMVVVFYWRDSSVRKMER